MAKGVVPAPFLPLGRVFLNKRSLLLRLVFLVVPKLAGEGDDGAEPKEKETGNDRQQTGRCGTQSVNSQAGRAGQFFLD